MNQQTLETVYFYVCAAFTVIGALSTVLARNPIRGAMGLLLTICGIAALFLSLSAEFLSAVQLIVYAGAVVVLFMFVIMLLGPAAQPRTDAKGLGTRIAAGVFMGVITIGGVVSLLMMGKYKAFPALKGGEGTIESVARELFGPGLVPFELSSALLMVAVVGAVAVARGKHTDPTRMTSGTSTPSV